MCGSTDDEEAGIARIDHLQSLAIVVDHFLSTTAAIEKQRHKIIFFNFFFFAVNLPGKNVLNYPIIFIFWQKSKLFGRTNFSVKSYVPKKRNCGMIFANIFNFNFT